MENKRKNSVNIIFPKSRISRLEICFSETCNQICDYCFIKKSSKQKLKWLQVKKALELFLDLPGNKKIITITSCEPLLYFSLYKKMINFINSFKTCKEITIVTTTNGLLLSGKIRDFIIKQLKNDNFFLNVSLDGGASSYNQHRKLKGYSKKTAFELVWNNLLHLPPKKTRIIFTITPDQIKNLNDNLFFIINSGFSNIDLFVQMFFIWPKKTIRLLEKALFAFVNEINYKTRDCNFRFLDRLWGQNHWVEILLSVDGNFYLSEWVLSLPYKKREKYIIGNYRTGIDFAKRSRLIKEISNDLSREKCKQKCSFCRFRKFCAWPLPLWFFTRNNNFKFDQFFDNFCLLANIFIRAALLLNSRLKDGGDKRRINKAAR